MLMNCQNVKVNTGAVVAIILLLTIPPISDAQSLSDCKTVFVQPMPESMDRFVSAELVKWGVIKVVTLEEKAHCVASFGRPSTNVQVSSKAGSTETSVKTEKANEKLPSSFTGFSYSKNAALEIIHRESSVVVWAESKTDTWSWAGGVKTLARKLVDQLKKDYGKKK